MHHRRMLGILAGLALILIAVFMLIKVNSNNWDYVIPKRSFKIAAIVLTGSAIAYSSLVFQTITNNRILTPSIMGLDSLYMLIQTFVVFVFGSSHLAMANKNMNFLISVGLMILFAAVLFKILFRRDGNNIYFLLLVGIIFGGLFQSFSSFMQMLIDPNEFQIVQDKMFASFNNINTDILLIAVIGMFLVAAYVFRYTKMLDVLSLGREHAVNLGIPYDKIVKRMLIIVAILVSISTALVGPITFLGLLVVNVTREFLKTYQHKFLIPGSVLISIIALVGGQLIVERVFTFNTTLSVIVNFVGGIYFIYLLLKENKAW
ncbi:iron chelate uptake ABC transporter family permease subunit [Paenibacillus larvae]|uniref:Iron-siderophore ABC transporter-like protein n=4 Tax=Paenibacillus larvae TaxID=1464 RepID=V9W6H3_9BACL|nr:iron chelate uptake ABC transporter family permease subunit [Paenibacillus larvae]AHD05544.1 iron-siderophore ABC transporter-like protein [Paenibacillus larvae subsp. larvae DSM 25430]AQR76982.1 iron ABC transporter permease [Paenibacillus larvae subsp. larvae]AQT83297.1 iron ABC transporter permease [Paenibacillus larvae subsp. pulvifaciens]AQZ48425.1 iron ABC transporter permease [Paenibacillus larvae subsp. pulvifaciens]ARF70298.1 iron ABC transporter permease [Paenibacillus larvae subs